MCVTLSSFPDERPKAMIPPIPVPQIRSNCLLTCLRQKTLKDAMPPYRAQMSFQRGKHLKQYISAKATSIQAQNCDDPFPFRSSGLASHRPSKC
jgi:hypothetical protein